jgi:hypothetical protein
MLAAASPDSTNTTTRGSKRRSRNRLTIGGSSRPLDLTRASGNRL